MIDKKLFEDNLSEFSCSENKLLEIYIFIDPLCRDCWSLEPVLKKLQTEYGQYFTTTYVLTSNLTNLNTATPVQKLKLAFKNSDYQSIRKCLCNQIDQEINITKPYIASIAVKAAELQGRKAGIRYLKKLQEYLYYKSLNITDFHILIQCAKESNIDIEEFTIDIHSISTAHAFQCDMKISNEMEVRETPTLVFFNHNVEEAGIKVTGVQHYDIYVQVMEEIHGERLEKTPLPPLINFIKYYQVISSNEIAYVYDWPLFKVEMEMKKLMLKQEVESFKTQVGTIWNYIGN